MELHKKDIPEAVEDTCEWLCDEPDYKSWLARSQSLLWIIGIPGSGKSTLMKYIYDQDTLQTETKDDKQGPLHRAQKKIILVSFFCYSAGASLQKTRIGLFRSLLHQILRQIPTWPSDLTSEFDKRCELQGEPGIKWEWHEHDLKEMLENFMLHIAKIYPEEYILRVYIDALDEFGGNVPNGGEAPMELAEYFESLTSQHRVGIGLNVCISCRDYPFLANGGLKISIGNKNRQDIWTYVQNKIARINGKHYEARELIKWIVKMASGIFQWAVIVVKKAKDLIKGCAPLKHILEFLEDLPEGLDDLYDKSFQIMDIIYRSQSLRLLRWICFSWRPLHVNELYDAMAFDPSGLVWQKSVECRRNNHEMANMIKRLSCNLVVINKHDEKHTVHLRHQSVYDYLVSRGLRYLDDSAPTSGPSALNFVGRVHLQLLKSCIHYLFSKEILARYYTVHRPVSNTIAFDDDYPFFCYAAFHWTYHAKIVEDIHLNQVELLQLYGQLLNTSFKEVQYRETHMTLLHIASQNGLLKLVQLILKPQNDPNSNERQSTADRTIKKLFQRTSNEIDVNIQDFDGRTPLMLAIGGQHEAVVELLLRRSDIQVNRRDAVGFPTLIYAVELGSERELEMLLQHSKVKVNATVQAKLVTTDGREMEWNITPLMCAARLGREGAVALLLKHSKIEVNAKDLFGRTALSYAAQTKHGGTAAMLLQHSKKIKVNAMNLQGDTALLYAARRGNELVVRVLLETRKTDIDISARNCTNQSPLTIAIEKRYWTIAELLLKEKSRMSKADRKVGEALEKLSFDERNRMADDMKRDSAQAMYRFWRGWP
jgi:ankyrin repeat protein